MASLKLMYQCTICFFAGPAVEALLHHECPGLGLIAKYLVMSNSNIYSEVHIHWIESLQFFCWHAFPAICSLQTLLRLHPILKLTSNKLTNWEDRDVRNRRRVYDQMEQLFANRKFHFCSHRNFRIFLNGKHPQALFRFALHPPPGKREKTHFRCHFRGFPFGRFLKNRQVQNLCQTCSFWLEIHHCLMEFHGQE